MDRDLTVIYYTANREKPAFEAKIQRALLETIGDLPLISVSQKPMDFGKNICVGDVMWCGQNAIRQFQIGAQEAKTRFVCSAESDFLYPKERFAFIPEHEDVWYGCSHWYILWMRTGEGRGFRKKLGCKAWGPITAGRELLIRNFERYLSYQGTYWNETSKRERHPRNIYDPNPLEPLFTKIPLLSFKTDENMHARTAWLKSGIRDTIPYWGNVDDVIAQYCGSGDGT